MPDTDPNREEFFVSNRSDMGQSLALLQPPAIVNFFVQGNPGDHESDMMERFNSVGVVIYHVPTKQALAGFDPDQIVMTIQRAFPEASPSEFLVYFSSCATDRVRPHTNELVAWGLPREAISVTVFCPNEAFFVTETGAFVDGS